MGNSLKNVGNCWVRGTYVSDEKCMYVIPTNNNINTM